MKRPRPLHIPTVGEVLALGADWTFTVIAEYRNATLMQYLEETGAIPPDSPRLEPVPAKCGAEVSQHPIRSFDGHVFERPPRPCALEPGHPGAHNPYAYERREHARYQCTLPRGTRLRVDRIYIRKGVSAYDSLTFWALDLSKKRVRFFARLVDVNTILLGYGDETPKPRAVTLPPVRAILLRETDLTIA